MSRGRLMLVFFILLASARPASAIPLFWDGLGDGVSWGDFQNWNPDMVPGPSHDVIIEKPGSYTVDLNVNSNVASLTLGGGGSNPVLVALGRQLSIAQPSTVQSGAQLQLLNNAAILGPGFLVNQGEIHLERSAIAVELSNEAILRAYSQPGTQIVGPFTSGPGSMIRVVGRGALDHAHLTIAGGFLNNGIIALENDGGPADARLEVGGVLTNTPGGHFEILPVGGGNRILTAALDNQGLLLPQYPLTIDAPDADHQNSGQILCGADIQILQSGASPSLTSTGGIDIPPGRNLTVTGGTFDLSETGTLSGGGTLQLPGSSLTAGGSIYPGFDGGADILTVQGDFPMSPSGRVAVDIGGLMPGPGGHDQLVVAGNAALQGTLEVQLTGGYTPSVGDEFNVVRYGSYSGGFQCVTGLDLGNGLYLETVYTPVELKLVTTTTPTTEKYWVNPVGGFWSDGSNWNDGRAPCTALENVTIEYAGSYSVIADVNASMRNLTLGSLPGQQTMELANKTFSLSGSLRVNPGGAMDVLGTEIIVTSPDGIVNRGSWRGIGFNNFTSSSFISLDNVTIENGSSRFSGYFHNQAGATFLLESTLDNVSALIGGGLLNDGVIRLRGLGWQWYQNCTTSLDVLGGPLTNSPGGTIVAEPGGPRRLNLTLDNFGFLAIQSPTVLNHVVGNLTNSGEILVEGAWLELGWPDLSSFVNSGRVNITAGGGLNATGGPFRLLSGSELGGGGTLDLRNVTSSLLDGIMRVGDQGGSNTTGIFRGYGNWTFGGSSILEIDVAGLGPGTGHDQLFIDGSATLDGTLRLNRLAAYVPNVGDEFPVFLTTDYTGQFRCIEGLDLGGGLYFQPVYEPGLLKIVTTTTPTTEKYWINPAGGLWTDGSNWSDGRAPCNILENVTIEYPGTYSVFLSSNATIGNLLLGTALPGRATLELRNNTFSAAIVDVNPGGALVVQGTAAQPVLFTSRSNITNRGFWSRIEFADFSYGSFSNLENVTLEYGGNNFYGPFFNLPGSSFNLDGSRSNVSVTLHDSFLNEGAFQLYGGLRNVTVFAGNALNNAVAGVLDGEGSLVFFLGGSLSNSGIIRPGGIGNRSMLNVSGTLNQFGPAHLNVDIAGLVPGVEHDQLNVFGDVTLDGTLDVVVAPGYTPAQGDLFKIMGYQSHTGTFSAYTGLNLTGGQTLVPIYTPDGLYLEASGTSGAGGTAPLRLLFTTRPEPGDRLALTLDLPWTADVAVGFYDILGRRMGGLVEPRQATGRHLYRWSTAQLAGGVYFARLVARGETGPQLRTTRFMIVR